LKQKAIDFGLISKDPKMLKRCKDVCDEFGYTFKLWTGLESFFDESPLCRLVLASTIDTGSTPAAEYAQAVRGICPDSFIACVVSQTLPKETATFLKKSGANQVLLENELYETSKLEYSCTQSIRTAYLPIKASDLKVGVPMTFDIYHLLPLRRKFLKFAKAGMVLEPEAAAKLNQVGEIYIDRMQLDLFREYVRKYQDNSAAGLAGRCRSQYLALYTSYAELVFMLTDQSENLSFKEGADLLLKCKEFANELIYSFADFKNGWDIVNDSAVGEFGSVERAPAIAVYAALFALQVNMQNVDEVMISALLMDLGLLLLSPVISKKIRDGKLTELTKEEKELYEKHPNTSLNIILNRRLPVEQKIRDILLTTHERTDGKGFPNQVAAAKIPEQAQLIQFSEDFDRRTVVRIGEARVNKALVREECVKAALKYDGRFSPTFTMKLKNSK